MPSKTYIETTLAVLHLYGCDPTKPNNIFIYTNKVCIILASLMMLTLGTTYYFLNQNGIPLQDLVKLVDSFITPIQTLNKLYLLTMYSEDIGVCLEQIRRFWSANDLDAVNKKKANATYDFAKKATKTFVFFAIGALASYTYYAIFTNELMFLIYVPNGAYWLRKFVKVIQIYFVAGSITFVTCFDAIFMYINAKGITQLGIIRYKIETIMANEKKETELKQCVRHHAFLVSYFRKISRIYSVYFTQQYLVSLSVIGIQMFLLSDGSSSMNQLMNSLTYGVALLVQFGACYCYISEEIHTNMLSISEAVYNSKWYEGEPKFVRNLLFVLRASQRAMKVTAGGMFDINLAAFTNLFKASISMVTFFNTLKSKSN